MIKIRYVVEVVLGDCFLGTRRYTKAFESAEEAWKFYREENSVETYSDVTHYAEKPYITEEVVEEEPQPNWAEGFEGIMTREEITNYCFGVNDYVRLYPSSGEPDPEVHQLTDEEVAAYFPDYDDEIDLVELTNSL